MASAFTTLSKVMTIKRLGLIYNPKEPNSVIQRAELEQLGSQFGYRLVEGVIENPQAIQEVVTSLIATQIDAVLLPSDSLVKANADIIIPLLNQHKIPSIASIPAMVRDNNAFIGIGPDYFELGRMAGDKALAILTGTLPNDVPSTRPDRMHMTVNLATAREIGINVPVQLLRLSTVIR
jgi:putative ABC transport system substrate-binding protein